MGREGVNYGQMVGVVRMIDSLWGHPKHQGREEHRHDAKKE